MKRTEIDEIRAVVGQCLQRIEKLEKTLAGRDETIANQQEIIERLSLVENGLSTANKRIDGLRPMIEASKKLELWKNLDVSK